MSIFDGDSIYDESPAMRELRAKLAMDNEAELTEDEMDEDGVDYQQQRIDELLRQRYNLRADLNTCELDNDSLRAEVDELRGQLEDEKSENGWAREFLNRIGPKCGKPDCKSLVDYVGQLESERDELQEKARRVDEADSRWEYMRRDLERMTAERDELRMRLDERNQLCVERSVEMDKTAGQEYNLDVQVVAEPEIEYTVELRRRRGATTSMSAVFHLE